MVYNQSIGEGPVKKLLQTLRIISPPSPTQDQPQPPSTNSESENPVYHNNGTATYKLLHILRNYRKDDNTDVENSRNEDEDGKSKEGTEIIEKKVHKKENPAPDFEYALGD
ncbi:16704_t:CDS:1 [Acaulospora colombiana]|uniref:16704_t:CDS:1 n=1 Tax=Acaulospora colombiana TaxID=27376 RepID=A0ACA9P162_9GLOM|nr:16704_t:CDS:1 [Acaulospora colombiana]